MKSGQCPKCSGNRIAVTSFALYLGAGINGPTIDLYACADCRLIEQYLRDSVETRVSVLDSWQWLRPDPPPFR